MKSDAWFYEGKKIIINRAGDEINYKIKKDVKDLSYIKWVKKDFDELNKYLYANSNRKITKDDYKKMFKQDVNVLYAIMDKDGLDWNPDNEDAEEPTIYILCEYQKKQRVFDVPDVWWCYWGDNWTDYKDANIDFFTGKGEFGKEFFSGDITKRMRDAEDDKDAMKINYNADVVKNQIDIFSFI